MKYLLATWIVIVLSHTLLFSQNKADSTKLKKELLVSKGQGKVKVLNKLARLYQNSEVLKALDYATQAMEISIENKYKEGIAEANLIFGEMSLQLGNYLKATEFLYESLSFYEKEKLTTKLTETHIALGKVKREEKNIKKALEHLDKAEINAKNMDDKKMLANIWNVIGTVYYAQKDTLKAKKYYEKAMNADGVEAGSILYANILNNIAILYMDKSYQSTAIDFLQIAAHTYQENHNRVKEASVMLNLSSCYKELDRIDDAIIFAENSWQIAYTVQARRVMVEAMRQLADLYFQEGYNEKAFGYLRYAVALKDTILNEEVLRKTESLESTYQLDKKDLEIDLLNKQKQFDRVFRWSSIGILTLILILLFFIIWVSKRRKKMNQLLQYQNEAINQQKEEIQTQAESLKVANTVIKEAQEKSESLLLNILPKQIAEELKETNVAQPQQYEMVSVLFTDFKGFTQTAENLSPEELLEELNHCFLAFDDICQKHGLEKIKTIGDAYMAVGGLPLANTSNPLDTVQAGLEIRDFIQNLAEERTLERKTSWQIRVGIHTGKVIAGVIGKNKFAYDVWGDTVNLASRMESSGAVGKVNISAQTFEYVKDTFHCEYRGKINAKNKGEVNMYFVEN